MGRGGLRADVAAATFGLTRYAPSDPLAPFVDNYWIVRWDLRGQPPHEQTILPHPNVHLVFESSGAGIYGADRRLFTRVLTGVGKALGVRFRAGCFRLFSGLPERDPVAEQVADLVALIGSDVSLQRVDQLTAVCGVSVRGLQRMFADYVGVSPKWVVRRARLHKAALRADGGEPVDWAALALDLGYADQAHLTRDFTATIGVPPGRYLRLTEGPWRARPGLRPG
jgi:AraC-like DNA-binding protein